MIKNALHNERGIIAILALMAVSIFGLAVITTASVLAMSEVRDASSITASEQTFLAAESGLNEALLRLGRDPLAGFTTPLPDLIMPDGTTVEIDIHPNGFLREITAIATDKTGKERRLYVETDTNTFAGGFDYAVQGGAGGIIMMQNTWIDGNDVADVYSNGDIIGANKAIILGSATAAQVNGIPSKIDYVCTGNLDVPGGNCINAGSDIRNMFAYRIQNSEVWGNACAALPITGSVIHGTTCDPNTFIQPEEKELSISPDDVRNKWEPLISTMIPYTSSSTCAGPGYCIDSDLTLNSYKINSNLTIAKGHTITLTGNLWVNGGITFEASSSEVKDSVMHIDPSLIDKSVIIIADDGDENQADSISIKNNFDVQGSGDPRSFVILLSMKDNNPPSAIEANNNSNSLVLVSVNGELAIRPNGEANALVAYRINLENNSHLIYNPNLKLLNMNSSGSNVINAKNWQER